MDVYDAFVRGISIYHICAGASIPNFGFDGARTPSKGAVDRVFRGSVRRPCGLQVWQTVPRPGGSSPRKIGGRGRPQGRARRVPGRVGFADWRLTGSCRALSWAPPLGRIIVRSSSCGLLNVPGQVACWRTIAAWNCVPGGHRHFHSLLLLFFLRPFSCTPKKKDQKERRRSARGRFFRESPHGKYRRLCPTCGEGNTRRLCFTD